jgi:hypothetical protein
MELKRKRGKKATHRGVELDNEMVRRVAGAECHVEDAVHAVLLDLLNAFRTDEFSQLIIISDM